MHLSRRVEKFLRCGCLTGGGSKDQPSRQQHNDVNNHQQQQQQQQQQQASTTHTGTVVGGADLDLETSSLRDTSTQAVYNVSTSRSDKLDEIDDELQLQLQQQQQQQQRRCPQDFLPSSLGISAAAIETVTMAHSSKTFPRMTSLRRSVSDRIPTRHRNITQQQQQQLQQLQLQRDTFQPERLVAQFRRHCESDNNNWTTAVEDSSQITTVSSCSSSSDSSCGASLNGGTDTSTATHISDVSSVPDTATENVRTNETMDDGNVTVWFVGCNDVIVSTLPVLSPEVVKLVWNEHRRRCFRQLRPAGTSRPNDVIAPLPVKYEQNTAELRQPRGVTLMDDNCFRSTSAVRRGTNLTSTLLADDELTARATQRSTGTLPLVAERQQFHITSGRHLCGNTKPEVKWFAPTSSGLPQRELRGRQQEVEQSTLDGWQSSTMDCSSCCVSSCSSVVADSHRTVSSDSSRNDSSSLSAFLGVELIDWLRFNLSALTDRGDALSYADQLLQQGHIRHVVNTTSRQSTGRFDESSLYICLPAAAASASAAGWKSH